MSFEISNQQHPNDPDCHHCHLTAPIPLSELIKTHPLRLSDGSSHLQEEPQMDRSLSEKESHAKVYQNTSDRYSSSGVQTSLSNLSEGEESNNSNPSTWREKLALLRPSTSFLHQFTKTTLYKRNFLAPPLTVTANKNINKVSTLSFHERGEPSTTRLALPRLFIPPRSHEEQSIPSSASSSENSSNVPIYQSLPPPPPRYEKKYPSMSGHHRFVVDSETQTTVPRSFLKRNRMMLGSSMSSQMNLVPQRKRNRFSQNSHSLSTGFLIAGYILLVRNQTFINKNIL